VTTVKEHPIVAKNRDVIHKIGVSGDVKSRVAGAKKDPTYLLAGVEIVATFKLANVNRRALESLLQALADAVPRSGGAGTFSRGSVGTRNEPNASACRLVRRNESSDGLGSPSYGGVWEREELEEHAWASSAAADSAVPYEQLRHRPAKGGAPRLLRICA
jgi:hypothetical protein